MTFNQKLKALDAKCEPATADTAGTVKQAANIADSTATTVADLKGNFNSLLAALKAAGIMAADAT